MYDAICLFIETKINVCCLLLNFRFTLPKIKRSGMRHFKILLYIGMANIWTGIVLRFTGVNVPPSAIFFSLGGLLKLTYVYVAYRQGRFKPGYEMCFLAAGLLMLMSGIMVRNGYPHSVWGSFLVGTAIVFKVTFLVFLIRKMREQRLLHQVIAQPINDLEDNN
jgi:hypothetical protein